MVVEVDIDFCIEQTYELMIESALPEEFCESLLAYYNGLKEKGQTTVSAKIRIQ